MSEKFPPMEYFHFRTHQLDKWHKDREVHNLRPEVDFPEAMTFKQLEKRMKMAAWNRGCHVDVWPKGDGSYYVCFKP
jgi:hypothetical protein